MKGTSPSWIFCIVCLVFSIAGAVGGWIFLHQEGAQLGVPKDRELAAGVMLFVMMGILCIVSFIRLLKCFKAPTSSSLSTSRARASRGK